MKSLKKTEKIFSNSIDISTKAEYIVTIKSYLHPNKRFGKERKMKKVLSVLAVLAVAAGFAFADAAANFDSNGNTFKLKTTVEAHPHVFFLSTDGGSNALAADEVVDKNVDLTKDGTYDSVKLYLAVGGNQTKEKSYTVTVSDTDFVGDANSATTVKTDVVLSLSETAISALAGKPNLTEKSTATISVPAGKTSLTEVSTVTVNWTGVPALAADTYVDTITVTVAAN